MSLPVDVKHVCLYVAPVFSTVTVNSIPCPQLLPAFLLVVWPPTMRAVRHITQPAITQSSSSSLLICEHVDAVNDMVGQQR
jgi:hypothetical protein